ncbi:unnamed protein product [Effrenium voratum]|uniref:Photolyase/cryptochrome alpha/beta domain-containing protein n=1 Tax=Effrenium voratum TaxID=2562239 RepID=A0AA36MK92_9DINO|nr:unnamed protein product [Effrenium voratum]
MGDLRLRDNPALFAAAHAGPTVPLFVWCPAEGTALQAALAPTLRHLDAALWRRYGSHLRLLGGGEDRAFWARLDEREEPCERAREGQLARLAAQQGVEVTLGAGELGSAVKFSLVPCMPLSVLGSDAGMRCRLRKLHSAFLFRDPERCRIFQAVQRFGPVGMKARQRVAGPLASSDTVPGGEIRKAVVEPPRLTPLPGEQHLPFAGDADAAWPFKGAMPTSRVTGRPLLDDSQQLEKIWGFTEEDAQQALAQFQKSEGGLARYKGSITRDAGPKAKESRLAPYFRLGLLSMVDLWWRLDRSGDEARKWFRRCAWRDYAYWMLHYWPSLPEEPMRMAFRDMPWLRTRRDAAVEAWRQGTTGFPLVDAGMRELRSTGYLQQNLRHTVGQFLVETLGADWRVGEEWFHLALADSDLAINSMMWQHQGLAGVSQWLIGIDCHPVRHARAADPQGEYVRYWIPELSKLPLKYLHCPWEAPADVLNAAGVKLGTSYPRPVVADVDVARAEFLERARRCRAAAPWDCFSADGCDLLALPTEPSPLRMERGIWALTERRLRGNTPEKGGGKGKGKGKSQCRIENRAVKEDEGARQRSKNEADKREGKGKGQRRWNDAKVQEEAWDGRRRWQRASGA